MYKLIENLIEETVLQGTLSEDYIKDPDCHCLGWIYTELSPQSSQDELEFLLEERCCGCTGYDESLQKSQCPIRRQIGKKLKDN